jgi:DNA repair exonuclease SbcCD nuclease subunit
MKVLLITDQHFGVRNDNQAYIEMYKKFYGNLVIPFIDKMGIDTIICLGDTFDKRKSINFMSLDEAKQMWFDPLEQMGVKMYMLVGNHDIYYKNTLRINAPAELLGSYNNIDVVESPTTITLDSTDILLLPWICDDNRGDALREVQSSTATVCMGHLELDGFEAHPGAFMKGGMNASVFDRFDKVFSGHFHMKSSRGNINYLGNPYQLYWNDYGCKRGFHVFDTETLKTTFYRNPNDMFRKVYYNNGTVRFDNQESIEGTYVKLIVEEKENHAEFDEFLRELQEMKPADLNIIENLSVDLENGDVDVGETEDTLTLLETYIDEAKDKIKADTDSIKKLLKSLYIEACEI